MRILARNPCYKWKWVWASHGASQLTLTCVKLCKRFSSGPESTVRPPCLASNKTKTRSRSYTCRCIRVILQSVRTKVKMGVTQTSYYNQIRNVKFITCWYTHTTVTRVNCTALSASKLRTARLSWFSSLAWWSRSDSVFSRHLTSISCGRCSCRVCCLNCLTHQIQIEEWSKVSWRSTCANWINLSLIMRRKWRNKWRQVLKFRVVAFKRRRDELLSCSTASKMMKLACQRLKPMIPTF